MDVQTAAQLTAEAQALCERLGAAVSEAQTRHEWTEAGRIATVRRAAVRRYGRRLEAWSMAAYGHRVMPEGGALMASYCWHAMEYLDAFGDKAGWQRLMDEMPEGARWQLDAYFPEVRKHCTWCIEAESSVRQTNGLNIEAVWEQRRCLRQSPDGRGVAYLASGGAAIAYGPCCLGNCPIGRGIPLEVR